MVIWGHARIASSSRHFIGPCAADDVVTSEAGSRAGIDTLVGGSGATTMVGTADGSTLQAGTGEFQIDRNTASAVWVEAPADR